jgi:glucose/arabinose dehydrogenase
MNPSVGRRPLWRWGRRIVIAAVTAAAAVALLAACVPPPKLEVAAPQTGLDIPWDVQFLPNGTMLYTERGGGLNAVVSGQRRLLWQPTDLVAAIEAGMMSIAVDPSYSTTHQVFVCFASTAPSGDNVRIARLTLDAGTTTVTNRTDILGGIPMNPEGELGKHSGCRLKFGPDGYLWVGTGDAAIGTAPQDPLSLAGKVLRIDKNGYAAPGNMGGGFDPRIESYGHRNVQGLAFRANGQAYDVEHGTGCDDEVNLLRTGANYGWDPVPRAPGDPSYDEYTDMTDLVRHPDAVEPIWKSGCPTIAPSGGVFLNGSQWGTWNGGLVLEVLKGSKLLMLRLSSDGTRVDAFSSALGDHGRLRSGTIGPDGALYVTTSNGSHTDSILRVTPTDVSQ